MSRVLVLLALLASASPLGAVGGFTYQVMMENDSRDSIEVHSFLENSPTVGFMPLRITIFNRSPERRVWTLGNGSNASGYIQSSFQFPVAAKSSGEFEIMVPLKVRSLDYNWSPTFRILGPGVRNSNFQLPVDRGSSSTRNTAFVAMSDPLHQRYWGPVSGKVSDLQGTAFVARDISADWRAYSGLDQIWMTQGEWQDLAEDRHAALKEWVALGGDLILQCESGDVGRRVIRSFGGDKDRIDYGAGSVRLLVAPEKSVPTARLSAVVRSAKDRREHFDSSRFSTVLSDLAGELKTAGPLVILFILVFGVVAGPVNLFVFAGKGKRHRLFVTTPVISVLGALVLAGLILIQDGTGGGGARLVHAHVLPEIQRMVITQEQSSRTGLLLGSTFEADQGLWIQPVDEDLTESSGLRLDADRIYSGSWFRSRSRQQMVVHSSRPTRGTVEWIAGETPQVISSLSAELDLLFVADQAGRIWTAEKVAPGERVTLIASDMDAAKKFLRAEYANGGRFAERWPNRGLMNGEFAALVEDGGALAEATLEDVEWSSTRGVVTGRCEALSEKGGAR